MAGNQDGARIIYIDSPATFEGEATFATNNYAAEEAAAPCEESCEEPQAEPEPVKEALKEIVFSKKVITERDIIEANRDGVKIIRLSERNILTALAKDAASARNIQLIRE